MHIDKLNKLIDILYVITVTALLFFAIKYMLPILLPFIFAVIVATTLRKPIKHFSKSLKVKESVLSFFSVSLVLVIGLALISLLIYSLYAWLSDILKQLPDLLPSLTDATKKLTNLISVLGDSIHPSIKDSINNIPSQLISSLTNWITDILSSIATGLPSVFLAVFVTILSAYIITRDYTKLGTFAKTVIPNNQIKKIIRIKEITLSKTFGLIRGNILLTLITFIQILIGLTLLRCKHVVALSAVISFIDLLPILGTGTILIPWSIYSLITGNIAFGVGIISIFLITTVVKNILSPKILGNQIKLDSLCVLASMYIGYKLTGVSGLIFAPFLTAIARDIVMEQ